jgi:FAD binding domain
MPSTAPLQDEVPVLIVGGGGAGLTASMLLAVEGVEHLLVSARPSTSDLPKAHVLNQRAMEVLDDVGSAPEPIDEIRVYAPSTRPDAPLPHAWVDDEEGRRLPIEDLVRPGRFLLIAGEDGHAWCEAARQLATDTDLPLDSLRIGHLDGELFDPRCTWLRHRQIAPDGAILVRPDRFVAWRAARGCTDPQSELAGALSQILARPVGAIAGTVGAR